MSLVLMLMWVVADWPSITLPIILMNDEGLKKYLPATMPGGLAVADFDGDGWLDIFVANGGTLPNGQKTKSGHANRLFRNAKGMKFEDVTTKAGVGGSEYAFGAAAGDYDGDGRPDLLVTTLRGVQLLRNEGNGRFADVTKASGLDNQGRWAIGAAWLDYDKDGRLDLFVVNYLRWDPAKEPECKTAGRVDFCHPRYYEPAPNALFRNAGEGRFVDVSVETGIGAARGKGMGAAVADFNADGFLDVFVTNDRMPAFLFEGSASGKFAERAFERGVAVPGDGKNVSAMGVDAQDVNGDGRPDLIYTALKDETWPLYRGSAQGFEDAGFAVPSRRFAGWGVQLADLNNDGRLDIVGAASDALSGVVDPSRRGPVVWFAQGADGKFGEGQPISRPAMHRGLVAADFDQDGCLDVVVSALSEPVKVLRNPCAAKGSAGPRQNLGSSAVGYASSIWDSSRK